jgi:hypothetical protein
MGRPKNVTKHVLFISSYLGHLPDFQDLENSCGLYWTSPTNVTKHVFLICSYLGHLPVKLPSMEAVFQIFKILKMVLGSTGLVRQMLQSMFC